MLRISAEGLRVYLETPTMNDATSIVEIANDKEILAMIPAMPDPYGRNEAVQFISFAEQRLLLADDFHMCVRLPGGELAGMCAIANIDRINRKAELGYWLGKRYWGHGYSKEAVRIMLGFGFTELGLNRVYAKSLPENERSVKLLKSVGFGLEGTEKEDVFSGGKFLDNLIFGILKSSYRDDIHISVER
jgi:RimJ/RimL family protein N-acetyltransferase